MKLSIEQQEAIEALHAFEAWSVINELLSYILEQQKNSVMKCPAGDAPKLQLAKARHEGGIEMVDALNAIIRKAAIKRPE